MQGSHPEERSKATGINARSFNRPVDHHPDYIGTPLLVMTYEHGRPEGVEEKFQRSGFFRSGSISMNPQPALSGGFPVGQFLHECCVFLARDRIPDQERQAD